MPGPIIIIPARLAANRLPGKPLAEICGEAMIVHVWRRATKAALGPVLVATDSKAIAETVRAAGGKAVLTRPDHMSGSDRIFEALQSFDPKGDFDVVINLQGDLPLIAPAYLAAALTPLAEPSVDIATLAAPIARQQERDDPNIVKVIGAPLSSGRLRALYFTRAMAPGAKVPSIITSGSMLIGGERSNVSWPCRPRLSNAARSLNNCARSKPACASMSPSSRKLSSALTRRLISTARGHS